MQGNVGGLTLSGWRHKIFYAATPLRIKIKLGKISELKLNFYVAKNAFLCRHTAQFMQGDIKQVRDSKPARRGSVVNSMSSNSCNVNPLHDNDAGNVVASVMRHGEGVPDRCVVAIVVI